MNIIDSLLVYSVEFASYDDVKTYASSNSNAYAGQIVRVNSHLSLDEYGMKIDQGSEVTDYILEKIGIDYKISQFRNVCLFTNAQRFFWFNVYSYTDQPVSKFFSLEQMIGRINLIAFIMSGNSSKYPCPKIFSESYTNLTTASNSINDMLNVINKLSRSLKNLKDYQI